MCSLIVFALLMVAMVAGSGEADLMDRRVAVVQNNLGSGYFAFLTDFASGKLQVSTSSDGATWSDW